MTISEGKMIRHKNVSYKIVKSIFLFISFYNQGKKYLIGSMSVG